MKTLRLLSLTALLATGAATVGMAAGPNDTTGQTRNGGVPGTSAQSSGNQYPGVVGPTGSRQSDATNPTGRMTPPGQESSGGGSGGCSGGGSGGSGTGGSR